MQMLRDSTYFHTGKFSYREKSSKVSLKAKIKDQVVLGGQCVIEDKAVIQRSVIGRGCRIGAGAVIEDSHIWDGNSTNYLFIISVY